MDARLTLQDSRMSEQDIQELVFAMMQSINQATGLTAKLPKEKGGAGRKGDAITLGEIILTAFTSGTVVAMVQVLKAYVERKPTLKMEIEAADGRKMTIAAEHFSAGQIEQTIQAAKQFCKD